MDHIWLGSNELIIAFGNETYYVLESYENYATVFSGHYEECLEYCERRAIAYKKEQI